MHKVIYFPENLEINLGFASKFRLGRVTLNADIFYFGLRSIEKFSCKIENCDQRQVQQCERSSALSVNASPCMHARFNLIGVSPKIQDGYHYNNMFS